MSINSLYKNRTNKPFGRKESKQIVQNYFKNKNNPQNKLKIIHITGTAGKGSTANMIAQTLQNANYKVGLFTSPHLTKFNERIKINNQNISDKELTKLFKQIQKEEPSLYLSEYLTIIAINHFLNQKVDYAIIEVFIGGKYDTTNIFNSKSSIVTIITSIGLDHQDFLGNSKQKILENKLGILKQNSNLFTRLNNKTIQTIIKQTNSTLHLTKKIQKTNLLGEFQQKNAGLAYNVLKFLKIDKQTINQSLNNIKLQGRLQKIENNIILDTAHNILGIKELSNYLSKNTQNYKKINYILPITKEQTSLKYLKYLPKQNKIIFSKSDRNKIKTPKNYENFKIIENPIQALKYIKQNSKKDELTIITGSIFIVSQILKEYQNKKIK